MGTRELAMVGTALLAAGCAPMPDREKTPSVPTPSRAELLCPIIDRNFPGVLRAIEAIDPNRCNDQKWLIRTALSVCIDLQNVCSQYTTLPTATISQTCYQLRKKVVKACPQTGD